MERKGLYEEKKEQTLELVLLFLKYNYSDIELADKSIYDISSSTVQRRLSNKDMIIEVFNMPQNRVLKIRIDSNITYGEIIYNMVEERRQRNLLIARSKGGKISQHNNTPVKDAEGKYIANIPKSKLERVFKTPEKQAQFLLHSILTFKLTYETIGEALDMDPKQVEDMIINYCKIDHEVLKMSVNTLYNPVQSEAKLAFLKMYNELIDAIKKSSKEDFNKALSVIYDRKYIAVKKKKQSGEYLDLDDYEVIIRHQLKYLIYQQDIADELGVSRSTLHRGYQKVFAENPDLYRMYNDFVDVCTNAYMNRTAYR
jgi:DNA invertase Pin-like site-specific DNA recombinase